MSSLLKNLLTKEDNNTFDEIKVGGFMVLIATSAALASTGLLCLWLVIVRGGEFEANSYLNGLASVLTACAAVLAAMGGGMGLRDKLGGKKQ